MPVLASNQLAGASVAGRLRQHLAPRGLIELAKEAAEYANCNCRAPLLKAKAEATPGPNFLLMTDFMGALLKAMPGCCEARGGPETAARSQMWASGSCGHVSVSHPGFVAASLAAVAAAVVLGGCPISRGASPARSHLHLWFMAVWQSREWSRGALGSALYTSFKRSCATASPTARAGGEGAGIKTPPCCLAPRSHHAAGVAEPPARSPLEFRRRRAGIPPASVTARAVSCCLACPELLSRSKLRRDVCAGFWHASQGRGASLQEAPCPGVTRSFADVAPKQHAPAENSTGRVEAVPLPALSPWGAAKASPCPSGRSQLQTPGQLLELRDPHLLTRGVGGEVTK